MKTWAFQPFTLCRVPVGFNLQCHNNTRIIGADISNIETVEKTILYLKFENPNTRIAIVINNLIYVTQKVDIKVHMNL